MSAKPIEELSRQRLAQIRNHIMRDIIKWTIAEPHRLPQLKQLWSMFTWLVYKREQKVQNGMRLCIRCERIGRESWHTISKFGISNSMKDKLSTYCSQCLKEMNTEYRKKYPERMKEYRKNFNKRHPGAWSLYRKRSYQRHRQRNIDRMKLWQKSNRAKWNAYRRNYFAQKRQGRKEA